MKLQADERQRDDQTSSPFQRSEAGFVNGEVDISLDWPIRQTVNSVYAPWLVERTLV